MLRKIIPDPFLIVLISTVLLASFLPARGTFAVAVNWLSTITVVLLFFFHGAKLAREQVVAGLTNWRLHLAILGTTFVMFPIVGLIAMHALSGLIPATLATGLLFLACLPSTVQSAIAFVGMAHGNVGAAVASASGSQMLGVVLTPILMGLLAGTHGGSGGLEGIGEVAVQILVPFVIGHLMRPWLKGWIGRNKQLVNLTDRSTIVIAVYSAFSAAVLGGIWHQIEPGALAILFAVNAVLLAIGLAFSWSLGGLCGFSREDRIALLFCGTKKSLVQGVPMARVLFPGAQAGVIVLPVMIFHQMQLMACAFIARGFANRYDTAQRNRD
ncbi:bile acid:sodium symporter [Sphingomonas sp. AP4-R1]|uniref:bile acid:sodium symporter family protein n=1 Tax=Sphingomonas sp. AP4-R1 TaxID=2735134 RepID=UPI001493A23A|nr:bile acid:sodium symporter family protein [Sphingomonas sp. AP4-R1]QJU59678.1 bile acid:sodium symporter [Sphingomonas sp. AP4-R1]